VPGTEGFEAVGRIVACLQSGVFRVELPNGHRLLAYAAGRRRKRQCRLVVGDSVTVQLSPFDLSKGRLKWVEAETD
jgi:translation initiation factor IF-1